jgi:hypothetical protein
MKSFLFIVLLGAVIISAGCIGGTQNPPDLTVTITSIPTQQTNPQQNTSLYTCPNGQECRPGNRTLVLKDNLTPTQKKISTDLLQLTDNRYMPSGMTKDTLERQMEQNHQLTHETETGKTLVYVYIQMNASDDITSLNSFVWNVTDRDPANHLVVAWVNINDLINLASLESVQFIRTVSPPVMGGNTR